HHLEDAVDLLGKDHHLIAALLEELAPPARPASRLLSPCRLLPRQPVRRGQGEHQEGEHAMAPHGSPRFLRWMAQVPQRLGFLEAAVRHAAAGIIRVNRLQGLLHRGRGQAHRLTAWPIVAPLPLLHHDRPARGGLRVAPAVGGPAAWAEGVNRVMPTTSVPSRSVQAVFPWPCRTVGPRRPRLIPSPAAAWAWASTVRARVAVAGTTKRIPGWASHPSSVPSK